ncbi:hypothetical protein CL634_01105 [bacterium]|nr:hypothetical protein [bacterium]|tara:strand:+ start:8151 stop:8351 length:201 start_codon:yes stop_codon:yes gene_type:complete
MIVVRNEKGEVIAIVNLAQVREVLEKHGYTVEVSDDETLRTHYRKVGRDGFQDDPFDGGCPADSQA